MKRCVIILIFFFPALLSAQTRIPSIQEQTWALTEVMYHDVVSPPAASRFYAYSLLTGYEILSALDPNAHYFQERLKEYPVTRETIKDGKIDKRLACLYGILETGKNIIPSGQLLQEKQEQLIQNFKSTGLSQPTIDSSVAFAQLISRKIVQYSKLDGYFKLSTRIRYKPLQSENNWQPTPPEYMPAVEPHWRTIRTFFLDSAQQFCPSLPITFSKENGSAFIDLAKEVYNTSKQLTEEQKLIAIFWDCNPFAVQFQGHMSIGLKKISPGGHWMGITGIVCEQVGYDFTNTILTHTLVALTLHDAFVSCWDEKYRSNRIRPETAINRYIDPKWKPLLQTPPFPEYSSGHSVISTAVAELLSHCIGNNVAFRDSTETYIGLPAREFSSFKAAAAEARISRLYGGIHFRDGIEKGEEQGRSIGEFIIRRINISPLIKNYQGTD